MYKGSKFVVITELSKETLRNYAEVKLLEPAYRGFINIKEK
ncbi:hypothetical protein [Pseudoneobacillus rhizosphaerae]|uniref:Uncharacterized protein n=1 Tax=Pseudoneobacillus rhizosphaerae TaxID=2880968 RepID=A0A9C7LA47_9BACI|nr:hypothetical protein [Pseudoneobacillus rhizosphaerae]CAG9607065.1 hypothetical protein NEOCIP111885_00755 [Pseudoneobacillus rhizosphaerae]